MIHTVKFILLTIIYVTAYLTAFHFGVTDVLWATDKFLIAAGISAVFIFYSLSALWKIIQLDKELMYMDQPSKRLISFIDKLKSNENKELHVHNLEIFIQSKITPIRRGSNSLVLLGLIGTIVGFILALSGVDPSVAGNPAEVARTVATLLQGMHIAFYTTLVGTVLHFCLNLYNRILDQASLQVVTRIISIYVK